jgi:RNA polymerase sigma factor (sigma-70 family)
VSNPAAEVEHLLRTSTPQVLGALVRRYGQFEVCEEAVQEALLAAAIQWPHEGVPANPQAWLITVASRRVIDQLRSEGSRRRREAVAAARVPAEELLAPPADAGDRQAADDTLILLFLCCHPVLSSASQVALTLRAVGGLTTAEIAHAFLVPEATMAQRISRAKQRIKSSGTPFHMPPTSELGDRLRAVLQVLYLIFNEGYTATSGTALQRVDLTMEAIRLTRQLHKLMPDPEVAGLLSLMLLIDARRPARTRPDGSLVPLAEQDRTRWNRQAIAQGIELITRTLPRGTVGPYQLQAAIAAIHDEAVDARDTDWRQILVLYQLLEQIAPSPTVTLNRAVAVAMVQGPQAGLDLLHALEDDERLAGQHRLYAVRGHLLEMAGDLSDARESYRTAARLTTSLPESRYLNARITKLTQLK